MPISTMRAGGLHDLASRLLKNAASFVLASLRGSTYRSVRLASSLTAALLDSIEQPAVVQGSSATACTLHFRES